MSLGIEYNVGADLFTYCKQKEQLTPQDRFLPIPTGPGLGVESTKMSSATLTRTRMPGAIPSGVRRTGVFRSGELLRLRDRI